MLILFVDDNPADFELARIALKGIPDLEFEYVEDFENFKKLYSSDKYAAIISDYNLSGELGTDIFQYVKETEPDIPFIIISGALGEARAIEVLKLGITDYVLKDRIEKLPIALLRALKEAETKKENQAAQQLLKENEEKYRHFFFNNPLPMWILDMETLQFLEVNEAAINHYGYTKKEFLSKSILDIKPPNDSLKILEFLKQLEKNDVKISGLRHQKKDNTIIDVDIVSNIVQYNHKAARLVLINDVTGEKKSIRLLKQSEEKYRSVVEDQTEYIIRWKPSGEIVFANQSFLEFIQIAAEDVYDKNYYTLVPEKEEIRFKNKINSLSANNSSLKDMHKAHHPIDGDYWQEWIDRAFFDEDGKVREYQSVGRDITKQKLAEIELEKSEEKFRKIFETIEDVYYQADMNGICTLVSPSVYALIGYDQTEVIGKELKWFHENPDLREGFVSEITEAGRSNDLETTLIAKDGKRIYVSANINLRYDSTGNAVGLQGIIHNITEKKKHELEREKLLKELSDKYNEAMQFNYIVSHNLRAPIASIIGLSNLINMPDISDAEKPVIIKHITDSTLKMDELVKDLNEILASRSTINTIKELIPIESVINSIHDTLKMQINESGCIFNMDIANDASEVYSVKSYLESILYNLINNALKFKSELRKPIIIISTKKLNNAILISVSDNGIGIDIAQHGEYIFGLYKRFNLNIDGKGLGLHMTKTQVEALGGRISIESEVEKGTTFRVTFNN